MIARWFRWIGMLWRDHVPDPIMYVSDAGIVTHANKETHALLGYDSMTGMSLWRLVPPAYREAHVTAFDAYIKTGIRTSAVIGHPMTVPILMSDGTELMVEILVTEINVSRGRMFRTVMRPFSESPSESSDSGA